MRLYFVSFEPDGYPEYPEQAICHGKIVNRAGPNFSRYFYFLIVLSIN
jgi:hypothetical protein